MTETRCIPVEELARVRELPQHAAERVHAEQCPRCHAALLALSEFEHCDEDLPAEAGAGRALAKLDAVIDTLTAAPAPARREPHGTGWLGRLFAPPAMRFAVGFAALAVVASVAWLATRAPGTHGPAPERVVRGEAASAGTRVRAVEGGWELSWTAVAGAEEYDVAFLDANLHEVARVGGIREPRLALRRAALPAGLGVGVPLLVEVHARAGGDRLDASAPAPIVLE